MKLMPVFFLLTTVLAAQSGETWYGMLEVPGQTLPLNIELTDTAGSLQSPDQSDARLPLSTIRSTEDSLVLAAEIVGLEYAGRRHGDSIVGVFRQATLVIPLTLYPEPPANYPVTPRSRLLKRPQEPTDFPYRHEQVSFPGGDTTVTLAGELTLPQDALPKAYLILVSGSGPQNRNEELASPINHRMFLVLSDYLTRHGYGVLRYDDRGVAESTGDFATATTADFAGDAGAAVQYLREARGIVDVPIGIAGHSEGGMVGPMVAVEDAVDFLVLLAAPGIPIDSLLLDQGRAIRGKIMPDEPLLEAAYRYTGEHGGATDSVFAVGLRNTLLQVLPTLPDSARESVADPEVFIGTLVDLMRPPWMRYFMAFDPADYLEQVTVPVLAINGELDQQVTIGNLAAVGAALERAENEDVTLMALPGVNHLLQPAETGSPGEYGDIKTTIAEEVLEAIVSWLDARYRD